MCVLPLCYAAFCAVVRCAFISPSHAPSSLFLAPRPHFKRSMVVVQTPQCYHLRSRAQPARYGRCDFTACLFCQSCCITDGVYPSAPEISHTSFSMARPASQASSLSLHWDCATQQWLLHDSSLGLSALLPRGPTWRLCFDAEGCGYVQPQGCEPDDSEWVSEFFDEGVVQLADGSLAVVDRSGVRVSLADFRRSHECLDVPIVEAAAGRNHTCRV